jgi:hypothetical protein
MPVVGTIPPVEASPNAWVSRSKSPHVAPFSARAVCVTESARTLRIRDRSITGRRPNRDEEIVFASEHHGLPHVGNARTLNDESREPIDHRVEHHTRPS